MALEGTLKDFTLAEIFQLISYQQKTGTLTLKGKRNKATITFKTGNIISAETSDDKLEDRLGYRLVKGRLLNNEQLQKALSIQKETLQRLGYILVNLKFISSQDMQKNLHDIICQKIFKLFRWKEGEYNFAVKEIEEFSADYFRPISTQSILMEAVRMLDEWPLIEKKIPSFDIIFDKIKDNSITVVSEKEEDEEISITDALFEKKPAPIEEEKIESKLIKLSKNEYKVYNAIDGMRSVKEIIDYCNMTDFDAARAIYDLLDRKLIYRTEEKRPVIEPKEEKKIPLAVSVVFYLVFIALAGISIFKIFNQLGQIARPVNFINTASLNSDKNTIDYLRIKRIALALDTYCLIHANYPTNLQPLVNEDLLKSEDIKDSQGREYSYQSLEDHFSISTHNNAGDIPLIISFQKITVKE